MKLFSLKGFALALLGLVVVAVIALQIVSRTPSMHTEGAVRDAVDAYIYGYPLITFDMARKQQTNVDKSDEQHAPMNQMIKMRTYLPIDNHCCAAPNADTLYTIAWPGTSASHTYESNGPKSIVSSSVLQGGRNSRSTRGS